MMIFTITLHNIPEGMAVGAIYAGWLMATGPLHLAGALALSIGIAIQNFPEGAVVSLPLRAAGFRCKKSFIGGVLSGAVEPAAAVLTIFLSEQITPVLPFLLSFAAGAMIYVVVAELIPELHEHEYSDLGDVIFLPGICNHDDSGCCPLLKLSSAPPAILPCSMYKKILFPSTIAL